MQHRRFIVFLLVLLLVGIGCSRIQKAGAAQWAALQSDKPVTPPATTPGKDPAAKTPGSAPAAPAMNPDNLPDVVAEVNGQPIKKAELLEHLRMVQSQMQMSGSIPPEKKNDFIKAVLDDIIGQRLVAQDAQAKKLAPAKEDIDKQLAGFQKQFPDAAAFAKALKDEGLTEDTLREKVKEQLTIQKYVETVVMAKVTVSDADAQKFYDENKDKMKEPEQLKASHILIKVDPKADEKTKKDARAKIDGLLKRARAKEDFAALAKANSEDPGSKEDGGSLPLFGKGDMAPEFEKAAWALKPNEISDVVETPFGYHIIKLTERKAEQLVAFDKVKDNIKNYLKNQAVSKNLQTLVEELRTKGKVKVLI